MKSMTLPNCMYSPPGFIPNELGDCTVIAHQGRVHLFHLTLPNHDVVAHAVSDDGIAFRPTDPALHVGPAGDCDDDMIWTMHVVRHPRRALFHMYYTACAQREHGQFQRVALATSRDLMTWKKWPHNPILEPRAPHYNANLNRVGFVSFRDPFVFVDDAGLWHMLVTARTAGKNRFQSGCVAHATSSDGLRWRLRLPLYAPSQFEDLEVVSLLRHGHRHVLFFNHFCVGDTLCRVADSLEGPWRPPPRAMLLPQGNVVFRFCDWNKRTLVYHWLRAKADWPRRGGAGAMFMAVPPPKEVVWDAQGNPAFQSFSGWKKYHRGKPRSLPPAGFSAVGQKTVAQRGDFDHFICEGDITLAAGRAAGIVFRADAAIEIANFVRLDFERQTIELHKWDIWDSGLRRFKRVQPTLVQSLPATLRRGQPIHVRLLACAEYIEVSLDGVVHLCAATYRARSGRFAWVIEDGAVQFAKFTVQSLAVPNQP